MKRTLAIATTVLALASMGADATRETAAVDIHEWPVPWKGRPRDPFVAPDGRVWFVGQEGDYLGVLEPASGQFKKFELDAGAGPHNLIVDARGDVWFSGNKKGYIGRLDPKTGKVTRFPMPDPAAKDPHTLVFDAKGDIWFTAQFSNFVGRLATGTGEVRLLALPTQGSRPYGIVVDASGRPWFNEFGTNKLGSIDPATFQLKEYPLSDPGARGRRIALSGGAVWYVDYARGFLARFEPASGKVREWPMPGGSQSLPYAMASDDRGRLWAVETGPQPNRLVGFDPASARFFASSTIPSGGGTVRHMTFEPRKRQIWFGTDNDTIGRAIVP
jgi:virginiamycin B lyase